MSCVACGVLGAIQSDDVFELSLMDGLTGNWQCLRVMV